MSKRAAPVTALAPEAEREEGLAARALRDLRERPLAYGVLIAAVVAGPFVTAWLFPQAPWGVGLLGGFLFGIYAALCAVPDKFLD